MMPNNSICGLGTNGRIMVYTPNGLGRDSYILNNNGGFYKGTINPNIKEIYRNPMAPRRYDLSLRDRPINRYYSNGNGRDLYVVKENPSNRDSRKAKVDLPSILRENKQFASTSLEKKIEYPLKSDYIKYLQQQNIIQKNVLDRLFYGKGNVSKRDKSPKVQFVKKKDLICNRLQRIHDKKSTILKESNSFSFPASINMQKNIQELFKWKYETLAYNKDFQD